VLRPAAEFLFHRTERVHVEFPAIAALDRRSARLLDQRGQPLPIEVSLTERDDAGHTILVADVALAQLGAGDYVLDVSAGGGAQEGHRQVGLRVIR